MTDGLIPWHRDGGDWSKIEKALEHFNLSDDQWHRVRLQLMGSTWAYLPPPDLKVRKRQVDLNRDLAEAIEKVDQIALELWGGEGATDLPSEDWQFTEGVMENYDPPGLTIYRSIRAELLKVSSRTKRDARREKIYILEDKKSNNYNPFKNSLFDKIELIWTSFGGEVNFKKEYRDFFESVAKPVFADPEYKTKYSLGWTDGMFKTHVTEVQDRAKRRARSPFG